MDARLSDAVFSAPAAPTLGGPGPLAPVPATPKVRTARVRVTSEAVGVRGALGGYYRSMPPYIDDLTREYGPDLYDKMQLDDQVSSSLRALCHGVLSDDLVLRPAVDDDKDPDFAAAKDAVGFCERATWGQTGGLDQWLFTMLKGAVGGGNRVSETVYRPEESGRDAGKWVLDRLKVKPRRSVAFAVDSCNNLAGILGLPPGGATWGGLAWGTAFDPANPPDNFLPRDKFCVLTWDPHDEDPRGSAILRCVYEPWWAKLQAAREWLAYLAQFGSPGLVGTTAEGADSSAPTDAYGNPIPGDVLTPEQDMANKVMEHRNGGVHILPHGATLDVLQSSNAGDAFLKKVDSADRAIAQGILLAMRAVMQSRFGSRADAEQGQDVAGLQTRYMKRWLARMVTEDLLRPLVRINYGPDAARRLCPYASLSPVEHQDLGPSLVAVSGAWKNGLIKNSQLPWVYEQFGMPPATPEELAPPPPQPVGGQPAVPGGPGEPPAAAPPAPPPAPPPGPPDLGFSDPDAGPAEPPPGPPQPPSSSGGTPPGPPAGFPSPWRRVRPDGWEEVYDAASGQWVAGDQLDPEDIDDPGDAPGPPDGPAGAAFADWEEAKHPRGQPENAGQFGPGGYGGKQAPPATATAPADPAERRRQKAAGRRAADKARREAETAAQLTQPPRVAGGDMQPALTKLFPEGFAAEDAHALVGAPKGSVVGGYANTFTGGVNLTLSHPHVDQCSRHLGRDRDGNLVMSNQMFFLKKANRGSGLGLQVFSEEVRALAALGVDRIETCAGKGGIMNGYYTWPRLGYDAPIHPGDVTAGRAFRLFRDQGASIEDADRRANALAGSAPKSVQDLMATPDGRAYWKRHGYQGGMTFDLKPGSRSLKVLNDYLASKGKSGIEVDAAKVDALKARREEARKAGDERQGREVKEAEDKKQRQAMNTARAYWRGQAAEAGISGDVLDSKAGTVEGRMIAEREADPNRVWGVSLAFPGQIRFDAYRQAAADLVAGRHAERMADPSLADVRGHYEREAESRGLDPARVRAVAAETAYAYPDAVYAVGRAYATAIDALAKSQGGSAPFAVTGPDLSGLGDLLNLSRQEVLDALFDAALDSFDLALPDAAFYSPDQPRVPAGQPGGGRWAGGVSPGTRAARDAASDAVRAFASGQGPASVRDIHAIAGHLAKLTVSQIHALKAQHGLKGSAPNKAALVAKLAQRFRDARAAQAAPAAVPPPAPLTYQQWVAAGRPNVAHSGQPPFNAPAPAPPAAPTPPPPGPSVLNRGANVITGAPAKAVVPVVPFAAERAWETGKPEPGVLNGIPFAPAPPKFWEKVKDVDVGEPPPARPVNRAGVLIQEPDGRVWIVQPTNQFGNRKHTLPGGGVEPGLTNQQNALKEVWEETGLQVEITGYAGDFEDSNNGNNGRLYLGRRVGGAPWDAKVESFIVSNKTGNPAAESETVTLVTPERAAQLLHRTDDLAQLMVAHPPPLDTPTRGKGSEALKKLVAAVGPAAREYERKRKAAGAYPGNAEMHAVQEMRGFNAKPRVVSKADFNSLMAKGDHVEVLRGVKDHGYGASRVTGKQLADQYREGEHFPGHGIFGSGTYADSNRGRGNVAAGYAAGGGGGEVLRMALPKDAKIIKESELEKAVPDNPAGFKGYSHTPYGKAADECWRGVQAALAGYDAIEVDGKSGRYPGYGQGFYVILNRGIVTVQDKAPPAGYRIP